MKPRMFVLSCFLGLSLLLACGDTGSSDNNNNNNSSSSSGSCVKNEADAAKYVTVGFWKTTDCSGDPIMTNSFPVASDAGCYCWPGNSGKNSANTFVCDASKNSFTYSQYTNLTCATGGNGRTKTVYTDKCVQDNPPTLYAKIVDFTACSP